jgi:hypothetical protein
MVCERPYEDFCLNQCTVIRENDRYRMYVRMWATRFGCPYCRTGHVHSRLSVATGVMRLGFATGRAELVAWGKRVFDWTLRTQCASFGWVGEVMDHYDRGCETCGIVDAIEAAALLARNGYDDYWGIVERFGRNHLLESQSRRNGGFNGHSSPNDYAFVDAEWVAGQTALETGQNRAFYTPLLFLHLNLLRKSLSSKHLQRARPIRPAKMHGISRRQWEPDAKDA